MLRKCARIFGAAGGALTLLTYLALIGLCVWALVQPYDEISGEGVGVAFIFILILSVPTLISIVGLIGSFLVGKKHILAGVMMIVSGVLTISLSIGFAIRYNYVQILSMGTLFIAWLLLMPQLILIFAGVLSLLYRPDAADKRGVPSAGSAG